MKKRRKINFFNIIGSKAKFIKSQIHILMAFILFFNCYPLIIKAADEYVCQYSRTGGYGDKKTDYAITIDKKDQKITSYWVPSSESSTGKGQNVEINFVLDQYFDSSHNEKYIIKKLENYGDDACQKQISVCQFKSAGGMYTHYGILFNTSKQSEIKAGDTVYVGDPTDDKDYGGNWYVSASDDINECWNLRNAKYGEDKACYPFEFKSCKTYEFYESSNSKIGTSKTISYQCKKYHNENNNGLYDKVKKYGKQYKNCEKKKKNKSDNSCNLTNLADKYNQSYNKLREFCTSVIKTQDSQTPCMEKCLGMTEDIKKYRIDNSEAEGYKCYLSEGIIAFVYNILKWAKYIVPALVIILSILDFIKAIAASSDDDMKKAQSKFIKRLIVAAILFLLPLIINFMLKTFGLYNSKCDIGSLFS